MEVEHLRSGLWRWTAPHPAWRSGADWPQEGGCLYYEAADATVLVDPLVPAGEEDRFWPALDRDVERRGLPLLVVLTAPWHGRSSAEIAGRYGGQIVPAESRPEIDALPVPPVEEGQLALFLPEHGALVTAEILADHGGGLRVCPSPALREEAALAPFLQRLLMLPVELILPAHGPPVLKDARRALAAALAHAPSAA